jgi:hypothetical protein
VVALDRDLPRLPGLTIGCTITDCEEPVMVVMFAFQPISPHAAPDGTAPVAFSR